MDYICPNCSTVLTASENLLKELPPKLTCPKCGASFNPTKEIPLDSKKLANIIHQLLNSDLH